MLIEELIVVLDRASSDDFDIFDPGSLDPVGGARRDTRPKHDVAAPAPRSATRGSRSSRRTFVAALAAFTLLGTGYAAGALLTPDSAPRPAVGLPGPTPSPTTPASAPVVAPTQAPLPAQPPGPVVVPAGVAPAEPTDTVEDSAEGVGDYGPASRTHFVLGPLTPSPATAPTAARGYGYDPRAVYSAETITRLAAALDIPGAASRDDWSWHIGTSGSSAPTVGLSMDSIASFWSYDPAADVPWCDASQTTCPDVPPGPSGDDAVSRMRTVLAELGTAVEDYTFTVLPTEPTTTFVSATADGLTADPYGRASFTASYTAGGLVSLYGSLAPRVSLGDYAIVTPAEAVGRLSDTRFTPGGWSTAPERAYIDPGPVTEPPATPTAGAKVPWQVQEAVITTWELTTEAFCGPDGTAYDLPAYRLGTGDGYTWTVLAVANRHLAF